MSTTHEPAYTSPCGRIRVECDGAADYALFVDDSYAGSHRSETAAIDAGSDWLRGQLARERFDALDEQAERDAEAERLLGELNQVNGQWDASLAEGKNALAITLRAAYDSLSARIRALGFDIGPAITGGLCLYDKATQLPLSRPLAEVLDADGNVIYTAVLPRAEGFADGRREMGQTVTLRTIRPDDDTAPPAVPVPDDDPEPTPPTPAAMARCIWKFGGTASALRAVIAERQQLVAA